MKKLSHEQQLRHLRRAAKRARRKKKKRHRARHAASAVGYVTIEAPSVFRINSAKHRRRTIKFLDLIRTTAVLRDQPVLIDFANTKKMYSDGTLLFRAEMCRIHKITEGKIKIKCRPPRNKKVGEVLRQTGIYRLLRHHAHKSIDFDDVVDWAHADGSGADGKKYDEILGRYDGTISATLAEGLYLGLTEAMTNCHHHAYLEARNDGLSHMDEEKDWWMFSQEKDGWLSVVFCDLGIGIPGSLPKTRPSIWSILTAAGTPNDGAVIAKAIEESRTRTGKSYRGKGLKQLVDTIDRFDAGFISIHSNRGLFSYDKSKGRTDVVSFGTSILGTLISWRVPLPTTLDKFHEASSDQHRFRIF